MDEIESVNSVNSVDEIPKIKDKKSTIESIQDEQINKEEKTPWKNKDVKLSTEEIIKKKFDEFRIIPNLIDDYPTELISIIYQTGVKVNLGNTITNYQSRDFPCLFYWPVLEFGKLYTIMFIDMDYRLKSTEFDEFYLILLVYNIHANDVMKGDILAEYSTIPSINDNSITQHRIACLCFKQESFYQINLRIKKDDKESRCKFSLKKFIKKYNLGKPYAGNFFICSN